VKRSVEGEIQGEIAITPQIFFLEIKSNFHLFGGNIYSNYGSGVKMLKIGLWSLKTKLLTMGNQHFFLHDIWLGGKPLSLKLPRLFSLSLQRNNKVSQMGR